MTQVRLEWTPNPAEEMVTSYNVYQTVGMGGTEVLIGSTPDCFYVIPDVPTGIYAWRVQAVNLAGVGPQSAFANGPSVPSAPAKPTVTISEV